MRYTRTYTIAGQCGSITADITGTLSLGNGLKCRKAGGDVTEYFDRMEVEEGDKILLFPDEKCPPSVQCQISGGADSYLYTIYVPRFDNSLILEDFCYGDSYEYDGTTNVIGSYFVSDDNGAYIYEPEIASFRMLGDGEISNAQRYNIQLILKAAEVQTKCDKIDAYFDSADIVFADYAVGDNQVDTWITANVSVAGLYMTYVESTGTKFRDEVTRVQLGPENVNGRWENKVYCGTRIVESKQLTPDTHDSKAVKYRFYADFVNNGKDDIEIQQLNILSTMKIFEKEGGENA